MRTVVTTTEVALAEHQIISPKTFQELLQHDELRMQTLRWEKEYRCAVENDLSEIRSRAYAIGLQEGLVALSAANQAFAKKEASLERLVSDLVGTCLQRIFAQVPKQDLFEVIIKEVLEEVKTDHTLTILCHPTVVEEVRSAVDSWKSEVEKKKFALEILIDCSEDLEIDICEIYTDSEIMIAGIPILWKQLVQTLEDGGRLLIESSAENMMKASKASDGNWFEDEATACSSHHDTNLV